MKLIKIKEEHYVVVDDSEIKENCWALHMDPLGGKEIVTANGQCKLDKKITQSTQPMPHGVVREGQITGVTAISLQEVKELIGEVDVEKKAETQLKLIDSVVCLTTTREEENIYIQGFYNGYNQSLEDNKEKKYTEEDMWKAFEYGKTLNGYDWFGDLLESIQPKTEWEVEFVDGKLKIK